VSKTGDTLSGVYKLLYIHICMCM